MSKKIKKPTAPTDCGSKSSNCGNVSEQSSAQNAVDCGTSDCKKGGCK